ncbi:hypothetical protein, partial [Stenotrophomonas maltophilia]|uniref:hypothetical protein n=1 Tax=Stenotrophomonas maltophilia TaxID=40324 RepID=UPI001954C375
PAIRDLALCKPHSQVHGTGRMDARVSPADPSNLAWSECILEADQQGTGIPQVRRIDARRQSLDGGRQLIE